MALIIFSSPYPQDFQISLVPVRMSGQAFLVFGPTIATILTCKLKLPEEVYDSLKKRVGEYCSQSAVHQLSFISKKQLKQCFGPSRFFPLSPTYLRLLFVN